MGTTNDPRVKIRDDILITSLDEQEGIVLDVESKRYYLVNETGLFLLKVIEEHGRQVSPSFLKTRLLQEYDASEDEAERDVSGFLRGLTERSLAFVI